MKRPYDDEGMPSADDMVKEYFASQGQNPDGSPVAKGPEAPAPMPVPEMTAPPSANAPAAPAMNPDVNQYLSQKFNLGEYGDDQRKKLADENKVGFGDKAFAALAALGAGFQGKDAGAAGQAHLNSTKQGYKDKMDSFDKGRQGKIQEFDLDRKATGAQREDEAYGRDQDKLKREMDPNSQESKMANDLAASMGYKGAPITAQQFKDFSPVMQKKYEIAEKSLDRAENRKDREADREFRRQDQQLRRDELASNRNTLRQDKLDKEAKLSDKQIEAFSDIDRASSDLTNILGQLGDKSGWTGPVDGRIPDMLVGNDQVAWRSAVGKYKDAYRKAITGAGAGPTEIAMLESRLPSENDTLANFQAKAQEAQKELARHREIMAGNLEKGGKNVSEYKKEGAPKSKMIKVSNGKETLEIDESDLADAEKDGYKRQ